jgi:hypothetical protein
MIAVGIARVNINNLRNILSIETLTPEDVSEMHNVIYNFQTLVLTSLCPWLPICNVTRMY